MRSEPLGWDSVALRDICPLRAGIAFKRELQGGIDGSIPFIKVSDMSHPENAYYIRSSANWVSHEDAVVLKGRCFPPDTVVFAKIGEALKANRFRIVTRPTLIDNNMMGAIPNVTRIDARFLLFLLEDAHLAEYAAGSALPYLRSSDLNRLVFSVPQLDEQRRIARVLGALDDKVDSNRRLRALLKEMGAIHFSHVRSEGTSEQDTLLEDLVATIKRGITPRYSDDGLLVLNQRCVRDNTIAFHSARRHDDKERAVAEDRLLQAGDVLVNSTGVGTLGRLAPVTWLDEPATIDSHVTIIRPHADLVDSEFLAWDLMSRQSEIEALAEGTTGQTELSRKRLAALRVSIPDRAAQESFSFLAVPLREQRAVLEQEDLTLTGLRKDLLPKLISGQIRVPDTDDPGEVIGPVADRLAAPTS